MINLDRMNIDHALPWLCRELRFSGTDFDSRAGKTKDFTFVRVTLTHPKQREITLPSRKHNLAAQIAETMWVLSGRDDVEWLERYLPRAADFSDDGRVWRGAYGPRIRNWQGAVDQLEHVVTELKKDPNTRRAVIAIYDPMIDVHPGKDIPCNDFLTFAIRDNKLDVGVTIRSNDLIWGWSGINAFEWSALQEIVAGLVGVAVGSLHFSITSLHMYDRHWERAEKLEVESGLRAAPSPHFHLPGGTVAYLDELFGRWFALEEMIRFGHKVGDLVNAFPEPMLRSWLQVLQWWWSSDEVYLAPLNGTRLIASAKVAVQPPKREKPVSAEFVEYVTRLHSEKHAAYGDSWKRRGEMLGIMANIARKIDRLGGSETADESSADTAIDLLVYLAKYRWWLFENASTTPSRVPIPVPNCLADGDPDTTNALIRQVGRDLKNVEALPDTDLAGKLTRWFDDLEEEVKLMDPDRYTSVDDLIDNAFLLARSRWQAEQK